MGYRCEECNAAHFGPSRKLIKAIRPVNYSQCIMKQTLDEDHNKILAPMQIGGSTGTEIVKEVYLCEKCYDTNVDVEPKLEAKKTTQNILPAYMKKVFNKSTNLDSGEFKSFGEAFKPRKHDKHNRQEKKEHQYDS